jgi:hypothetical protein
VTRRARHANLMVISSEIWTIERTTCNVLSRLRFCTCRYTRPSYSASWHHEVRREDRALVHRPSPLALTGQTARETTARERLVGYETQHDHPANTLSTALTLDSLLQHNTHSSLTHSNLTLCSCAKPCARCTAPAQ